MSYYDTLKNYIESVLFDGASADAPLYAADSRALYNASPVASRMLRIMQQLSADAEKAGSADMTLDEIVAARNEKVKFLRLLKRSKKIGFAKGRIDEAISQIVSLGCASCNVRFFNSIFLCFF
jgi:hypothetical protein